MKKQSLKAACRKVDLSDVDVAMFFPPPWDVFNSVHLGIPLLSGYLREQRIRAKCFDLNATIYDRLISDEYLTYCIVRLEESIKSGCVPGFETEQKSALILGQELYGRIDLAKESLRGHPDKLSRISNSNMILLASDVICRSFAPTYWNLQKAEYRPVQLQDEFTFSSVFRCLEVCDPCDFFRVELDCLLQHYTSYPPVVGVAAACSDQVLTALYVARFVKQRAPDTLVVLGGAAFRYLDLAVCSSPRVFDYCDVVIVGDGELPILQILGLTREKSASTTKRKFDLVANARYREHGKVLVSKTTYEADSDIPKPSFDGIDFSAYLSLPSIPILTSRRCYWNKCVFCSVSPNRTCPSAKGNARKIAEHIHDLSNKHHCRIFTLVDESIEPDHLSALSDAIIERKINIRWSALLRFDKNLNEQILGKAYNAGCRIVLFGLESASPKVLQKMRKGILVQDAEELLKVCWGLGFWTNVFVILGFPGETEKDRSLTTRFVRRNANHISSILYGPFGLERGSIAFISPESIGIVPDSIPEDSLAFHVGFEAKQETSDKSIKCFDSKMEALPCNYFGALNITHILHLMESITTQDYRRYQWDLTATKARRKRLMNMIRKGDVKCRISIDPHMKRLSSFMSEQIGEVVPFFDQQNRQYILLTKEIAETLLTSKWSSVFTEEYGNPLPENVEEVLETIVGAGFLVDSL